MNRSYESSASNDIGSAMRVEWGRQARADLAKLAKRDADRIQDAVTRFAKDRHGDVQRVRRAQSASYRLRAGRFRVIFEWEEGGIRVHRVHHRREAYRKSAWIRQDVPTSHEVAEDGLLTDAGNPVGQVGAQSPDRGEASE